MKNIIYICHILLLLFFNNCCNAQHISYVYSDSLDKWSLKEETIKSDAIVEGEVINEPRWSGGFLLDPKSRTVFTSIIIRVSRVFKGNIKDTTIELITEGGTFPSGEFKGVSTGTNGSFIGKGYQGIFFLRTNNTNIQSGKNIQSFFFLYFNSYIAYTDNSMHLPYPEAYYEGKMISDFENILYKPIEAITGTPAKVIGLNSYEAAAKSQQR